jgi:hypothetical protein
MELRPSSEYQALPGLDGETTKRNAIFTLGPLAGAVSGSIGGTTFSHNRGGSYMRRRAIPVVSTSPAALAAKNRLAAGSQAWQTLTDGQRLAWTEWSNENPSVNALGNQITLTGHQSFVGNHSRQLNAGTATLTAPPIVVAPDPLISLTASFDIGIGDFDIVFTATPIGAAELLWLVVSVHNSPAINYVENIKRFVGVSTAAQASPFDSQALIEAKFGTLVVGQHVDIFAHVFSSDTGLLSTALRVNGTVVST